MITRTSSYTVDLDKRTVETRWNEPLTCGDKNADKIQVTLMRGGSAATLSGLSAILYGVRSDGTTAIRAGSVSGNVVTAELDYTFYLIPGQLELLLQLTEGTTAVYTPLRITARVKFGQTDELVSTGEQFSLAQLQSVVSACQTATSAAASATAIMRYTFIKWSAIQPTSNSNMKDSPDAWIGVYVGTSQTAPTAYTSYKWYQYKGIKGDAGVMTYSGTAITGTSVTPSAYATGITMAYVGDRYYYNGAVDTQIGNVYRCTLGGNAATACWVYDGNIRGATSPQGDGVPPGGNTGQALCKSSVTDYATQWNDVQAPLNAGNPLPMAAGGLGGSYSSLDALFVAMGLQQLSKYRIQIGVVTITVPAGQVRISQTVTFPVPFSSAPVIITSLSSSYPEGKSCSISGSVSPTASGVTVLGGISAASASDIAIPIQWVAIGPA